MNNFIVILSCVAAVTIANPAQVANPAQNSVEYLPNGLCRVNCRPSRPTWPINRNDDCPPVNCPPPVFDPNCGPPVCNNGNRWALHPHPDPNRFWQCAPYDAMGNFRPVERWCACGTVFSLAALPVPRCVHPWEWAPQCPGQNSPPILSEEKCRPDCPTCDDGPVTPPTPATTTTIQWVPPPPDTTTPPWVTVTPPPIEGTTTNGGGGGGCECPCVPCIWWPCLPCLRDCLCNGVTNPQRQPPQQEIPIWQQPPQQQPPVWQPPQQQQPRPQPPQEPPVWQQPAPPSWQQPVGPRLPWEQPQQRPWQ